MILLGYSVGAALHRLLNVLDVVNEALNVCSSGGLRDGTLSCSLRSAESVTLKTNSLGIALTTKGFRESCADANWDYWQLSPFFASSSNRSRCRFDIGVSGPSAESMTSRCFY